MDFQLSLVAKFDDLARKKDAILSGFDEVETHFVNFVWQQESCRQKWLEAGNGSSDYKNHTKQLEEENAKLQTKLKHARNQIDHEIRKRIKVEQDKDGLDRNIKMVRDLLTDKNNQSMLNPRDREKLAFLSTDFQSTNYGASPGGGLSTINESASLLSPDISYDKTEDDLDVSYNLRSAKRPTAPPIDDEITPPEKRKKKEGKSGKERRSKNHRRSNSASVITTTSVTVKDGNVRTRAHITQDEHRRDSLRKYPSAGDIKAIDSEEETTPKSTRYLRELYTPGSSTLYRTNSAKSLNRPHSFVSKTVIKPEQCVWCGKKIKFGKPAMKCRDCKATAHPECREQVPLPCVPTNTTPNSGRITVGSITDYAPSQPPFIPAIVIHCVNEIESRGFNEQGIYRRSGAEREIKELKERFLKGRGTPNLSHVNDIHVVCGCLKDFLRGLKEPLVTYGLWQDFVKSAEMQDSDEGTVAMYNAISQLPKANRDTIAFLIIHLQKVSEFEECQMNVSNLARVFGPTIVGYSCPDPAPMDMINSTGKQQMVIERLILISRDYWENVMNFDGDGDSPKRGMMPDTPEVLHSMLGPVGTPGDSENRSHWYTPKLGSTARSVKKKPTQFFASPVFR